MIPRKLRLHQEDRLGSHLIPVTINGDLGLKVTKLPKGQPDFKIYYLRNLWFRLCKVAIEYKGLLSMDA